MTLTLTPAEHQRGTDWLLARLVSFSRIISAGQLQALLGLTAMTDAEMLALPGFPAPLDPSAQTVMLEIAEVLSWWLALSGTPR